MYLRRVGIALSQLLHALMGGNEDITTSAQSHIDPRLHYRVIKFFLNTIDPGHTKRAYEKDKDEWEKTK